MSRTTRWILCVLVVLASFGLPLALTLLLHLHGAPALLIGMPFGYVGYLAFSALRP